MPMPEMAKRSLAEMIAELESAVRAGDRARATELERTLLQRLATERADAAAVERQVRALMALLDELAVSVKPPSFDTTGLENTGGLGGAVGGVYTVWFGTNRKPNATADGFTNERHHALTLGRVDVFVPETHRFGEIGSSFLTRLSRFNLRDDRLRIQNVALQERDDFFREIQQAMQAARDDGGPPHAVVFLHGYNVSFEETAIRAAQIGFDLKVAGATAFFSWPSRGSALSYPADEASIEASEGAIVRFLVDFTQHCGAEKVHLIAHSMGNLGLLRSLQRIAADTETRGKVKFGQVMLAAPDVDRDLFLDLARLYPEHAERTTLYASDGDLAVHLAAKMHEAPRAGYFLPYTVVPGIDTVAVPNFDVDLLGHNYFAEAEALLYDIYDLLRHGDPPASRQRIVAASHEDTSFWTLRR
jgi:esterase/lipase superfamily enzyme